MKLKGLFVFCLISGLVGVCAAQTRTVTNDDLEQYRKQRVKADRELKEDFDRLGFSSPEEREKREADSQRKIAELADRLKLRRIEQERIDADRANAESEAAAAAAIAAYTRSMQTQQQPQYYDPGYYNNYGYGGWGGYWGTGDYRTRGYNNNLPWYGTDQGYVSGGMYWPNGGRTTTQPMIIIPKK
jgi:hypothetical protein